MQKRVSFPDEIPIISEDSNKADLLAYIRILEARLEIDVVPSKEFVISTGILERGSIPYVSASQRERVEMLQSGMDAVSLRDAEIAVMRERD